MNDDSYNKIMDRLRKLRPEPASARKLTDRIMNAVDNSPVKNQMYFTLKVNEKQWNIYRVLRTITTTAALFLIGFFIIQQWEINRKLYRLENELVLSHKNINADIYPSRNERIQKVIYELREIPFEYSADSQQTDVLQINRKSLNYMLEAIRELEKENTSFRKKLMEIYADTTSLNPQIR